jgi:hypothetical protein
MFAALAPWIRVNPGLLLDEDDDEHYRGTFTAGDRQNLD